MRNQLLIPINISCNEILTVELINMYGSVSKWFADIDDVGVHRLPFANITLAFPTELG